MNENLTSENHVKFLQTLSEAELTELVIMPLLEKMEYRDIRYTHGISERGKDIIFVREDQLAGLLYLAAAVKSQPLTGSVSSSKSIHEILFQLQQALVEPYVLPFNGQTVSLEMAFCFTPYPIPPTTIESIAGQMRDLANRVRFVDGPRLVSLIQKHLPELLISLPDPESRYLHHLCSRFLRATPLGSLGESQQSTVHDLFVPTSISAIDLNDARFISFAKSEDVERTRCSHKVLLDHRKAVVIADVGSGKTTLMQRLLIESAKNETSDPKRPLPVFIPLAQFHESDLSSVAVFKSAIEAFVNNQYGLKLVKLREANRSHVYLFDGFDELVARHEIVTETATDFANQEGCSVIVTSRPSRVPSLPNFEFYRLNPFTDKDISEFLQKWFTASSEVATEVYERIQSNTSLASLCRTPLMLTLYSILASQGVSDSLPTRRTDVYRTVTEMLLGRWDSVRKIKNSFSADVKQQVLEAISLDRQQRQQRRFGRRDVHLIADEILRAIRGRTYRIDEPELLFYELIFRSSLIRPTDSSEHELEFVHLSFQEYFAACALQRKGVREVMALLEDDWWRNTFRFYFGISRSLDSVVGAVRSKKVRHGFGLTLLEFLSEADYTNSEGRKKVFEIVGRDLARSTITDNELAICRRLGNDVVEALDSLIEDVAEAEKKAERKAERKARALAVKQAAQSTEHARSGVGWIWKNVFRVLLEINTDKAQQVLLRAHGLLDKLTNAELLDILELYLNRVPLKGNQQFLVSGLTPISQRSAGINEDRALRLMDSVKAKMGQSHLTKSRSEIEGLLSRIASQSKPAKRQQNKNHVKT